MGNRFSKENDDSGGGGGNVNDDEPGGNQERYISQQQYDELMEQLQQARQERQQARQQQQELRDELQQWQQQQQENGQHHEQQQQNQQRHPEHDGEGEQEHENYEHPLNGPDQLPVQQQPQQQQHLDPRDLQQPPRPQPQDRDDQQQPPPQQNDEHPPEQIQRPVRQQQRLQQNQQQAGAQAHSDEDHNRLRQPRNLQELDIPPAISLLPNGLNFLLYDNGADAGNRRMLIFGTRPNLSVLSMAESVFSDGTFSFVDPLFSQLYTIHGKFQGEILPFVYMYLPNKMQVTYAEAFRALKNLEPNLNPRKWMSDFERAAMNAVMEIFQNVELSGCLFHFGQCV